MADELPAYILDAFRKHDADASGALEAQELPDALADCAIYTDDATLRKIVAVYVDVGVGLSVHEFANLVLDMADHLHRGLAPLIASRKPASSGGSPAAKTKMIGKSGIPSYVRAAFKRFDVDSSGTLDALELPLALRDCGFNLHPSKAQMIISLYDDSPDGALDIKEFHAIVRDLESGTVRSKKDASKAHHAAATSHTAAGAAAGDSGTAAGAREARSYALKKLLKQATRYARPMSPGTKRPSLLEKESYDQLAALERLDAMAHEALNNAKHEVILAKEAEAKAKALWKEKLQYRGVGAQDASRRFSSPGRERLVRHAEAVYWRARSEVGAKEGVVMRARKDVHESKEMAKRAARRSELKAQGYLPNEIQTIMAQELAAGTSAAAEAQVTVAEDTPMHHWDMCKSAIAAVGPLAKTQVPPGATVDLA